MTSSPDEPRDTLVGDFLQKEPIAAKDARAQRLLKSNAEFDACGSTEKTVTMDEILMAGADLNGHDVARHSGGEGNLAWRADSTILRHKERAATSDALDRAEEPTTTGVLGVGGHLDGDGHPRELTGLGDNGVVGAEGEFEDRHRGAKDAVLHKELSRRR